MVSCIISPESIRRTIVLGIGIAMIIAGWLMKSRIDKEVITYLETEEGVGPGMGR